MEGDAEPPRDLARAEEKRRRGSGRGAELALERNEAVRVRTGDTEVKLEILGSACLLDDLVELVVAVEGEAAHRVFAIGPHDRAPRLDRVHEEQLGIRDPSEPLDLDERGHVEAADAGLDQRLDNLGSIVGLGSVEHAAREIGDEPACRALGGMRPQSKDGPLGAAMTEELRGRSENVKIGLHSAPAMTHPPVGP